MSLNKSAFLAILLGIIILGIGVVVGYFSSRTLISARAMKTWREVSATVVSCDLQVSHGSKGGPTYQARATYQYEVDGVRHTGNRVSLHTGSDNVGSFQRRVHADLKQRMERKQPAVCWVNPADPNESVLIRKPRMELLILMQLFVMIFGGAGLAILLTGVAALFQPSVQADSLEGQGRIRMRGASSHRVAGVLAVAWNGYAGWFLWTAAHIVSPEQVPWFLWLFAASGIVPAGVASYLIGRFRKFGVSVFEMSPMPGVLGGPVTGTIQIPAKVETTDGFDVSLRCIHQYTTRSGKSSTTHCDVLWEDARHLDAGYAMGETTMLPVRFAVPYEEPATTVAGGKNGYYWRLSAKAAAPGIDYKAVFDVPVMHTRQSSPSFVTTPASASAARPELVETVAAREGLSFQKNGDGGFELVFPARRQRSSALGLSLFVIAWSSVCVALWIFVQAPVPIALFFTLFDVIILLALVNMLFVARGVVIDPGRKECVTWMQVARFPRQERHIPFGNVLDVQSQRAGQSGNTIYYRVALLIDGGAPVTVGSGLGLWNNAESIAGLLREAMKPGC
jgi:hypothetical protein